MSTQDTPETDAEETRIARLAVRHNASVREPVPAPFARRLERERDEARQEAVRWLVNCRLGKDFNHIGNNRLPWEAKP